MKKKRPHLFSFESNSESETVNLARQLARFLSGGDILFLIGELGSGKTVFVKGLAKGLGLKPQTVKSPTFVLLHEYAGRLPLYHFDLYRLEGEQDLESLDLDRFFYGEGISVVEWAEKMGPNRPPGYLEIHFTHEGPSRRMIELKGHGHRYALLCRKLKGKLSE